MRNKTKTNRTETKQNNIEKAAAQVIIINNQLTDAEIRALQRGGIFPDMSVEEVREDEIEAGLWIEIRNQRPSDLIALKDIVQEYSGWTDRDATAYARDVWKACKKMMALSGAKTEAN